MFCNSLSSSLRFILVQLKTKRAVCPSLQGPSHLLKNVILKNEGEKDEEVNL